MTVAHRILDAHVEAEGAELGRAIVVQTDEPDERHAALARELHLEHASRRLELQRRPSCGVSLIVGAATNLVRCLSTHARRPRPE